MKNIFKFSMFFLLGHLLLGCTQAANAKISGIDDVVTNTDNQSLAQQSVTNSVGEMSMRVLWTVSGYVLGKNSFYTENDAKKFLFKPLDINDNAIVFDGRECSGIHFEQKNVDAVEYLGAVWQISPTDLKIDDRQLRIYTTDCDIPGFQEYMRLSDGRLIVPLKGTFFFFQPKVFR